MGNKAGVIVAGTHGAYHLVDAIDTCWTAGETRTREDAKTCTVSVITAGSAFCLAYNNYLHTGTWGKRDDGLSQIEDYFSQMGDHIALSDIHYQGMSLNHSHLPQSLGKRDTTPGPAIRSLHNSSMPLSFVYHNTKADHVPLLVATNGTHHHIGHLEPVDQNSTASTHYMNRRANFNTEFTHIGKGGAKVQCRSKQATMTVTQVEQFMSDHLSKSTSLAGLDVFTDIVKHNNFIGFSFSDWIVDKKKNYMSGQWAMEGETKGFGSNWESN